MTLAFELVSLAVVFVVVFSWTYRFAFNHALIRNYAGRAALAPGQINAFIDDLNKKYGALLEHMDIVASEPPARRLLASLHQKHIDRVVGVLFSTTVTLSAELVVLLLVQLVDVVDVDILIFKASLRALVVLVTLVQPPLIVSLYVNLDLVPSFERSPGGVARTGTTVALCAGWFYLLHRLGLVAAHLGTTHKSFLERKTNEVSLAGVTTTAILSGIGCTLTPIQTFRATQPQKNSEPRVNELIRSHNSTALLARKRSAQLQAFATAKVLQPPLLRLSGRKLLHKVRSFASFGAASEEEELQKEVETLEQLRELIYKDVCKSLVLLVREKQHKANGLASAVRYVYMAFSVYCVYRIFNTALGFAKGYFYGRGSRDSADALAVTVAKVVLGAGFAALSELLENQVSLVLGALLFGCSLSNVLVTFKGFGRILPGSTSVPAHVRSWLKHLVIGELVAVYVLATALLLRSNLPPDFSSHVLKLLALGSGSEVEEVAFIDHWFDSVFGIACGATFAVAAGRRALTDDMEYDEESMLET